jgi:hypothetical protein
MGRFNPVGNRKLRGKLDVFPGGRIGVLVQLIELERTLWQAIQCAFSCIALRAHRTPSFSVPYGQHAL